MVNFYMLNFYRCPWCDSRRKDEKHCVVRNNKTVTRIDYECGNELFYWYELKKGYKYEWNNVNCIAKKYKNNITGDEK